MKKKTKVLLSSLLAIGMSASLVTGATYALFTSNSTVNVAVTSGTVKVLASVKEDSLTTYSFGDEQPNGTFENGGAATLVDNGLRLALMTPGDKAEFAIATKNESNVNVLYRVVMNATGELVPALTASATVNGVEYALDGTEQASPWLAVAANATIGDITVSVEFPDADDNNDYKDKSANIVFAVEAVQGNAPANAVEGSVYATNAEQLANALAKGYSTVLTDDVDLTESLKVPEGASLTLNLNGNTITNNSQGTDAVIENNGTLVIEGNKATSSVYGRRSNTADIASTVTNGKSAILNKGVMELKNVTIQGAPSDTATGTASYAVNTEGAGSVLTVTNTTIIGRGAIGATNGAKVVVNGGTYHTPAVAWGHAIYAVDEGTEVIINDGTFSEGYEMSANNWGMYQIYAENKAKVVVNGGDFSENWDCANGYDLCTATEGVIEIYGGTFAEDPSNQNGLNYVAEGYAVAENTDGTFTVLQGVAVSNTEELQAAFDNATDGDVIVLKAGVEYDCVYLGRPTKDNDTVMYCETHDFSTTNAEEFKTHLNDGAWHTTPRYTTNLKNLTVIGASGATIAGLVATSRHTYGDVYDHVLDKDYDVGSAYYNTLNMSNVEFKNVNFVGKIDINTSDATSVFDGVVFDGCSFTTGGIESANGAAIRYYNESNNGNVRNLTVKNCTFENCYQGVYVQQVNGVTVKNSTFDNTGHNAIAIQSTDGPVDLKNIVITDNTFTNIHDRVVRFGQIGADSNITIQNNTATDSGDEDNEVMKAVSIEEGITTSISNNTWNGVVANEELKDKE